MAARRIVLDSRFRSRGTVEDYEIELFSPVKEINALELAACLLPKSSYPVVEGFNDQFDFDYNSAGPFVATLTSGRTYTGTELAAELQTQLNSAASTSDFAVAFSIPTGKLTISTTTNDFTVEAQTTTPAIEELLGFTAATSAASSAVGDNPINLSYPLYLHLDVDLFESQGFGESTWDKHNSHSFIVPYGTANFGEYEYYSTETFQMVQNASFANAKRIRIRWRPPAISTSNSYAPANWSMNNVDHMLIFNVRQSF